MIAGGALIFLQSFTVVQWDTLHLDSGMMCAAVMVLAMFVTGILMRFAACHVTYIVAYLLGRWAATLALVDADGNEEAKAKDKHEGLCSNTNRHVDFHEVKS